MYHKSQDIYSAPKIHYFLNRQSDHVSLKLIQKIIIEFCTCQEQLENDTSTNRKPKI